MPSVKGAAFVTLAMRRFLEDLVMAALKAASWAPSGMNNQPWRFAIIREKQCREKIAALTKYSATLESAAVLVAVFLDRETSYDRTKDCQAVGACLQNLLLALHSLDLGAVWIGEILKNGKQVIELLKLPDSLDLMAIVAVGHPSHRNQNSQRRPLEELILLER